MQARTLNKARNRQALLDATADLIAEGGLQAASVSAICERAQLSRGMVHLHFANKDALLLEVAKYLNEQYFHAVNAAMANSPDSAAHRILAVIKTDLSETLLNRHKVNIWYAFRELSRARADVLAYSDTRDNALRAPLLEAFMALEPADKRSPQRARDATHGMLALLEGMWTDYYLHSESFNRQSAVRILRRFIGALYPAHAHVLIDPKDAK